MFSAPFSLFLFVSLLSACVLHQLIAVYVSFSLSVCRPCPSLCMSGCTLLLGKTLFLCIVQYWLDLLFCLISVFTSHLLFMFARFVYRLHGALFLFLPSSLSAQGTLLLRCSLFWLISANISEVCWLLLYNVTNIQLLMRHVVCYINSSCSSFCLIFSFTLVFVSLFWLTSANVSMVCEWVWEGILSVYLLFLAGFCLVESFCFFFCFNYCSFSLFSSSLL